MLWRLLRHGDAGLDIDDGLEGDVEGRQECERHQLTVTQAEALRVGIAVPIA